MLGEVTYGLDARGVWANRASELVAEVVLPRRAALQPGLTFCPVAVPPAVSGLTRDPHLVRDVRDRHARLDATDQDETAGRGKSSVRVYPRQQPHCSGHLDGGLDATFEHVREPRQVISKAVVIVTRLRAS
jgi:hypothetical protein